MGILAAGSQPTGLSLSMIVQRLIFLTEFIVIRNHTEGSCNSHFDEGSLEYDVLILLALLTKSHPVTMTK